MMMEKPQQEQLMNQIWSQNVQTAGSYSRYSVVKAWLQLTVSIYLFSFLVSGSWSYVSFFQLKLFLISLSNRFLERKCMFLLFHVILAFLLKKSGSTGYSHIQPALGDGWMQAASESAAAIDTRKVADSLDHMILASEDEEQCVEAREHKEVLLSATTAVRPKDKESRDLITEDKATQSEKSEEESRLMITTAARFKSNECIDEEIPNTDELKKKFDEFIRKMKSELRLETNENYTTMY